MLDLVRLLAGEVAEVAGGRRAVHGRRARRARRDGRRAPLRLRCRRHGQHVLRAARPHGRRAGRGRRRRRAGAHRDRAAASAPGTASCAPNLPSNARTAVDRAFVDVLSGRDASAGLVDVGRGAADPPAGLRGGRGRPGPGAPVRVAERMSGRPRCAPSWCPGPGSWRSWRPRSRRWPMAGSVRETLFTGLSAGTELTWYRGTSPYLTGELGRRARHVRPRPARGAVPGAAPGLHGGRRGHRQPHRRGARGRGGGHGLRPLDRRARRPA